MDDLRIAQVINDGHAAAFMQILAKTYQQYAARPAMCRLTCIMYEGAKYLVATDGIVLIALPTNPELELGDYEGVPYLVKLNDDQLHRIVNGLLKQLETFTTTEYWVDESAFEMRAFVDESFFDKETLIDDVMLAHVADGKFIIDMEKPHTHMFKRGLYECAHDVVGFFNTVKSAGPNQMMGFFNNAGRGFALIMPIVPGTKIKKVARF
jgi:hypothetical protein